MTDRELLEMAAKAAGIKIPKLIIKGRRSPWFYLDETGIHEDISGGGDGTRWRSWSPLHNDGDALRLAVKMGMRVYIYPGHGDDVTVAACDVVGKVLGKGAREGHNSDPYAATRRAIVRAAAEIGRSIASASEAAPNGEKP